MTPTFDQATAVNMGGASLLRDDKSGRTNRSDLPGGGPFGTSTNNNVYMLASVQPTGFSTGSDVMFVRSTDGGQTFSAPQRINDDPINHNKWHWFGTFAVAPNGRLDAVWLDTRNAANNTDSQLFYSYSRDGGDTWSPNVAVSQPFNPFLGYPNQNKMGDYMTIVSDLPAAMSPMPPPSTASRTFITFASRRLRSNCSTSLPARECSPASRSLSPDSSSPARIQSASSFAESALRLSGISGTLSDPTLELHQGSTTLVTNDNWKTKPDGTSQQAEIEATTIPPTNDSSPPSS